MVTGIFINIHIYKLFILTMIMTNEHLRYCNSSIKTTQVLINIMKSLIIHDKNNSKNVLIFVLVFIYSHS